MHENTLRLIQQVQRLANQYYEAGRADRCLAEVWRRWVYPVYPICYETFRRYMATDIAHELKEVTEAKSKPSRFRQTTLFDF